jgi:hypothetical protein
VALTRFARLNGHGQGAQNMNLEELNTVTTIIVTAISPLLTVLTWLVTRERFATFWKRWGWWIIVSVMLLSILFFCWRQGWLMWLQLTVTWPLWGLILYSVGLYIVRKAVLSLISMLSENRQSTTDSDFYTIHGARWYADSQSGLLGRPPVCATCLMAMQNKSTPGFHGFPEMWVCRECGHTINWNTKNDGDLLEDVQARYGAEQLRKFEQR